ncbi:hypothetical protein Tco_0743053 [Tanacetum coccineum]
MEDPNITMEEYNRLEEEKTRKRGKVYNWETSKYGKIWYDEDVHDLRSVETEFPAIVFNDRPQHIDEFDLKNKTSLSEYDEEEQNVLYFNDLFPFNIIYPDDLKSDKGNDDKIDVIQYSGDMAPLPPRDQRHLWLRFQVEGYTEEIVHGFEQRLETDLAERLRMVYTRDDGQEIFVSHAWRRLFEIRAPLVREFILKFFSTCRIVSEMGLDAADTLCFQLGGARRSMTWRQFILALGGGRHLKRHAEGRKSGARLSGGHFIGRLAHHFGLVSDDGMRELSVVTPPRPERQPDAVAGAPGAAEDAPVVDEGA